MGRGFEPAVNGGPIEEAIRLVGISCGGSERGVSVREVTLILNDSHGFSSPFMVSSLIVSTSVLAGSEPAFAGRYDHQCQAYKSHGSVAVCVQWMKRKLGTIRHGKCYEWQISKKEKLTRLRQGNASHEIRARR